MDLTLQVLHNAYHKEDWPQKKLLILEGPAGVGKTTLLNQLRTKNPEAYFPVVHSSLRKRSFKDPVAVAFKSMDNDTIKLHNALALLKHNQSAMIDRCIVSQWVYHRIRTYTPMLPLEDNPNIDFVLQEKLRATAREAIFRGLDPYFIRADFHFIFLLPSVERLIELRAGSDKEYPNDPGRELFFYTQAYEKLCEELGVTDHHIQMTEPDTYWDDLLSWKIPISRPIMLPVEKEQVYV